MWNSFCANLLFSLHWCTIFFTLVCYYVYANKLFFLHVGTLLCLHWCVIILGCWYVVLLVHWYVILLTLVHHFFHVSLSFICCGVAIPFTLVLLIPSRRCLGVATHFVLVLHIAFLCVPSFSWWCYISSMYLLAQLLLLFFLHWCCSCFPS